MKSHDENCFITLTYNPEHLPERGQLTHKHFQDFMKRLRERIKPKKIKYFMGGEYGPENGRPHYHAIIFNHDWEDKKHYAFNHEGDAIYTSKTLESLWPYGYSSSAAATFESAAYVARYCLQKQTWSEHNDYENYERIKNHYTRYDFLGEYELNPEYGEMSNGIGLDWLEKYIDDVYPWDEVIINGKETTPPKYYDEKLRILKPDIYEIIKEKRVSEALKRWQDNTDERLKAKEQVAIAAGKHKKRGKI